MLELLWRPVISETAARRLGWGAGFLILTVCTAIVLKMLPEFGLAAATGLVLALATGWLSVGSQFPKIVASAKNR